MAATEFSIEGQQLSDRRSPVRWIGWHLTRYKLLLVAAVGSSISQNLLGSVIPILVGAAFTAVLETPPDGHRLTIIAAAVLGVVLLRGVLDLSAALSTETLAQRLSRDARDEIYVSLLGKSQTYHNRQRVGDLMARTANDVRQLGMMVNPGLSLIFDSFTALIVPIVTIALLDPKLLPPPLIFTVLFIISLRVYMRKLTPASMAMRSNFGHLNSGLAEAVTGIDVVKSTAQEEQEDDKFDTNATAYRDAFVEQGMVQARYLPPLLLAATIASSLLLGIYYHSQGELTIGRLVTYLGLVSLLRSRPSSQSSPFRWCRSGWSARSEFSTSSPTKPISTGMRRGIAARSREISASIMSPSLTAVCRCCKTFRSMPRPARPWRS